MKRVIVVGGGHAGIEAALALAKMNTYAILITGDLSKVASLPCNPSIGGPAKGIVVREIDALGGQMGKSADKTAIQMKMLNSSKGPAVRALRAQIDKATYPQYMLNILKSRRNLELIEGYVDKIIIENKCAKGIILENGNKVIADAVILCTGTYLNSSVLIGDSIEKSGPNGEKTTRGISDQLKELGFEIIRLKTGTPPRIRKESVDLSKTSVQKGDDEVGCFSFSNGAYSGINEPCYLTYTNKETHRIISLNINKSAMYSGNITGIGPRYCPSIEDKIVRFSDKDRHQIFLEPESLSINQFYIQGLSTSLPKDIQEQMVSSVEGLENAIIDKYAYAIEYDAINPLQLYPSLESKNIGNLFFAGQINGTSGYEEAAGQGLMAGINASLKVNSKEPFILRRDEAYIGVLIDDLVTKGTKEPYRLLTSRAEFRLLLRNDNADLRLTEYGHFYGLIDDMEYELFKGKKRAITDLIEVSKSRRILPNEDNNAVLSNIGSANITESISLFDLIKRPEFKAEDIRYFIDFECTSEVLEQVEMHIKYGGYIKKAYKEAEKLKRLENKKIPEGINYDDIHNISSEAREKLKKVMPLTIGQATRILGVNPTDIMMLMVFIEAGGSSS